MIDNFVENINKYKLLDNKSNKLSKITFDKINTEKIISFYSLDYISYGYIYVDIKNAINLELFYNSFKIASFNGSENKIIPCVFEGDFNLKIIGSCDNLSISILGATIKNKFYTKIIPNQKCIVKDRGNIEFLSYSSRDDIVNNNLTVLFNLSNVIDCQSFIMNNDDYLGYLTYNNGVYFYTNLNNYTSSVFVSGDSENAQIVPVANENKLYFVYIKNDNLYYKILDVNYNLSQEYSISTPEKAMPKTFAVMEVNGYFDKPCFGVNFDDGTMSIFVLYNNNWDLILTVNSELSRLFIDSKNIEVYSIDDYMINITKYSFNDLNNSLEQIETPKNLWNINDVIKVDDYYLLYNNLNCNVVSDDSL